MPGETPRSRDDGEGFVPDELIVKFKTGVDEEAAASVESSVGIKFERELLLPNYALASIPPDKNLYEVAASLRQHPAIELVELNGYYRLDFAPNDPLYANQWHFPQIQMPQAWDLARGSEVIVAVVDSGVAYESYGKYLQAPDLASTTFVAGRDFVDGDAHPNDDLGHGTHVAGTIAQSTNNGRGVAGIAYSAKIMPVRACDEFGSCTWANTADGIKWATDNGARVINLSLSGSLHSQLMEDAVNYANGKGVVVIASSGNQSASFVGYPAAYENAIAVGATRYDQTRAYYSNYGSELDLVAPGGDCRVDQNGDGFVDGVLQQTFSNGNPASFSYFYYCGTSMSAPHVSGVAALLIGYGNAATPLQVRQALQSTARDLGPPGWDPQHGYGLVQAFDALRHQPAPIGKYKLYAPWLNRNFVSP